MGTAADVEQIALVTVGDGPKRISVASYNLTIIGNGSGTNTEFVEFCLTLTVPVLSSVIRTPSAPTPPGEAGGVAVN